MATDVFEACWKVPLPKFPSHSDQSTTMSKSIARCVLLSIAEHDGEFAPSHIVGCRAGCSRHVAAWTITCLMDIGLVRDLGPDWDRPPGERRGGYKNNVRRLSIDRDRLAAMLARPRHEIERVRLNRERKAVTA